MASATALRVRYRLTPWWVKVILIFAASRVVTTIILLVFAGMQAANYWTGAHPDYFSFAGIWDGRWFQYVAGSGYPSVLPVTADGHVTQNAWAFLPGYPIVVGAISVITGASFLVVGVLVSGAFMLGSALLFYKLLQPQLSSSTALFSVVLFCFAPLSPIFQVVYAESMLVFFLMCALWFLKQRRYYAMLPFVFVMAFTRPSGLAFALALGLHVIYRWRVRRRDPFPVEERVAAVVATVVSALLGWAWPLIAAVVTGNPSAYTDTELSWRQPYVGWVDLVPFEPWIQGANWWVHEHPLSIVLLVVAVAGFAVFMFSPWVKRIGVDLRLWVAAWVIYLLAVFFPQSSVFRLFVPVFPLLGALAQPKSLVYRVGIVLVFIALQIGWIYIAFWSDGYDWTPP